MATAGTLQIYHSSWYCTAVMNSWYEGHWGTKLLPFQLPSRHICSQWEVTQWRLISTPQSTLSKPFFVEVCKEMSSSAVYSVSTPRGGRCLAEGQNSVEGLLFCGLKTATHALIVPWQPFTQRQEETHWAGGQRKGNVGICKRRLSIRECYGAGKLKQCTTEKKKKSGNIRLHGCYSELKAHNY